MAYFVICNMYPMHPFSTTHSRSVFYTGKQIPKSFPYEKQIGHLFTKSSIISAKVESRALAAFIFCFLKSTKCKQFMYYNPQNA